MTANQQGNAFVQSFDASTATNIQFTDREKSLYLNLGMKELIDSRMFPDGNTKGKGFESDKKRVLELTSLLSTNADIYLKENNDFVRGTYKNGALRNDDKDEEGIIPVIGKYGTVTDADDIRYGVIIELKDDVLYIVSEQCDIARFDGTNPRYNVRVKGQDNDSYNNMVYNTLKNPDRDLVWRIEFGSSLPTDVAANRTNNPEFRNSNSLRSNPLPVDNKWFFNGERKRLIQLLPGKGWDIIKYNIKFIKEPKAIVVDYVDPTKQVNCEIHPHFHYDVVQSAVRIAIASMIGAEQKYQVADIESKRLE